MKTLQKINWIADPVSDVSVSVTPAQPATIFCGTYYCKLKCKWYIGPAVTAQPATPIISNPTTA